MSEIRLDHVTKTYGETVAVESLDLTVADGEFVVLLGPTGAGKTTTLRLIAGLVAPDAGRLSIDGRDVTHAPPNARNTAFVFQQYSLYPHYTVYDNLAFPLRAPGRKLSREAIDAKVREVAALLRIDSKLGNKATRLSGGEMQRVAIGRALVRTPAVYLMDEPLSSLDAKLRESLRVELKRIQIDLGSTILYVTHDQTEALTLADRIGVLEEGRLVQIADPRTVYERPATTYVAKRLGSPPVNLLPAGSLGIADGPAATATIGVRPEDVVLGRAGPEGRVLTVEHLGAETVILVEVEGRQVHALAGAHDDHRPGDTVSVGALVDRVLYFDGAGARVAGSSAPVDAAAGA
ncbi:MAG: ABC transporter ATP-binding protein [Azospirillaceae bacterium]